MSAGFEVKFSDCKSGWIYLSVRAGDQTAGVMVLSQAYDPITQLLAWLEALAVGLHTCAFDFDDENAIVDICARDLPGPGMQLSIQRSTDELPLFDAVVERESIVSGFYAALVAFSESDAYVPVEWEDDADWSDPEVAANPPGGLPWRRMRSAAVEAWLALPSGRKPYVFNHWQRWLKTHRDV
jgi:hypothetical protein